MEYSSIKKISGQLMRNTSFSLFILFFVFVCTGNSFGQNVYRFQDKDGVWHFTDSPNNSKYKPVDPSQKEDFQLSPEEREHRRFLRYQRLIEKITLELDNSERDSNNKQLCIAAIITLKDGLRIPSPESVDKDFLEIIENAIFNQRVEIHPKLRNPYVTRYPTNESIILLQKARILKGMPI